MRTKKTKVTKKIVNKKAKRGRPKGSTTKKDVVIKSGKKTIVIKPKVFDQAEKLFEKAKTKAKNTADVLENTKVAFAKKAKKVVVEPVVSKKTKIIPSGIPCVDCGEDIPQQRIDACKGTLKCVKCSDVKTKKPIIINHGTGDNIYQEVVIVDDETFKKHQKVEEATRKALGKPTTNFFDEEEPKPTKKTDSIE